MMIYHSLRERLKNQHETIAEIISNLDEEKLNYHPEPGKWSIHDNVAHLAKYQPLFIERIQIILETNDPEFGRYNADEDIVFKQWQSLPVPELLAIIDADRETIFQLISSLPKDKLERKGRHLKYGNLSILNWTEFFLLHEAHHLFTIFQLTHG